MNVNIKNKNSKENRLETNLEEKMKYINRQLLAEKKIINDLFDYQGFDESIKQVYQYYDTFFQHGLKNMLIVLVLEIVAFTYKITINQMLLH